MGLENQPVNEMPAFQIWPSGCWLYTIKRRVLHVCSKLKYSSCIAVFEMCLRRVPIRGPRAHISPWVENLCKARRLVASCYCTQSGVF